MKSKPTAALVKVERRPQPTRRSFVAMLTAAAAAIAVRGGAKIDILRKTAAGKTRWVGHV